MAKVPTSIKKARGNPGKRTISKNEAKPQPVAVDELAPPVILSTKAKRIWRDIVKDLHACGLYTVADTQTLVAYCEAYAEWAEAIKQVWKQGHIIKPTKKNKLDFPVINPWVRIVDQSFKRFTKLVPLFGMSPASRANLDVTPPTGAKPVDGGFGDLDSKYG